VTESKRLLEQRGRLQQAQRSASRRLGCKRGAGLAIQPPRDYHPEPVAIVPLLLEKEQSQRNPSAIPICRGQVQDLVPVKGVEVRVLSSALQTGQGVTSRT
jgi:hypothetical protein